MSNTINISSSAQLRELVQKTKILLVHVFSDLIPNGNTFAPYYEDLAVHLEAHGKFMAFAEVNADTFQDILDEYQIDTLPAVLYFVDHKLEDKIQGQNSGKLRQVINRFMGDVRAKAAQHGSGSGSGPRENWRGAELPRGYGDITSQVEQQRCELLNYDSTLGDVKVLFSSSKPTALSRGQATAKDWVESDTDEQLMLFLPFQSMLKLHTLQITSVPPQEDDDDDDDETPMRPRTIKLFTNKPHNLGFDEAEDMAATQIIELIEKDWNAEGTANIPLRYVKFQNITSLVVFVVDGDGDSEKVRLDRLRLVGEAGEKREMGKLEKIGDEPGE